MEPKNNILQDIINDAYRKNNPRKLAEIIKPIYKVNLQDFSLTQVDLEKLNRLARKAEELESSFLLALVYNSVFSLRLAPLENFEIDFVLSIVNVLLTIYERISGTVLARRLIVHIKNLLFLLIKKPELVNEDKEPIFELLRAPAIRQDDIFNTIESLPEMKEFRDSFNSKKSKTKINGANKLINIFNMCSDIEEQVAIFTKRLPLIMKLNLVDLGDDKSKEFLEVMCRIIENIFFQTRFLLKINNAIYETHDRRDQIDPALLTIDFEDMAKDNQNEIPQLLPGIHKILEYKLSEAEIVLKSSDNVYPALTMIVDSLLNFPNNITIQRVCLRILERIYYLLPRFQKNLENSIITTLANISKDSNDSNKKEARVFIYKLIYRDASPEFKFQLQGKEELKPLYSTPYYNSEVLTVKDNTIESLNLNQLKVHAGFPFLSHIPAGQSFTTHIEVWKPLSIIYWHFTLSGYDIGLTVTRVAAFDHITREKESQEVVIYQNDKIEASKDPCKGALIVSEPGIFRFHFNNAQSWFHAKELRYNIYVLETDTNLLAESPAKIPTGKEENEQTEETKPSEVVEEIDESDARAVINITQTGIEYNIKTKDESYETTINYKNGQAPWERINEKILETSNQALQGDDEVDESSAAVKILMKIVYDEKALRELFSEDDPQAENIIQQLSSALTCIENLKENIRFPMKITNKIELVIERLMESKHLASQEKLYVICIDNYAKRFYGRYKALNGEYKELNPNTLCVADCEETNPEKALKSLPELYFDAESPKKQNVYLATLLANAFGFHNGEVSQFLIFENERSSISSEENQQIIKEIFVDCLRKGEADKEKEPERENGLEETKRDKNAKKIPEISFCDLKM